MKPAWSLHLAPGSCRRPRRTRVAVGIVSSLVVIARTTSTSAIIGAGLKKWMPHTSSGRPVSIAISTTGRVDVLVGEDRAVGDDAVELAEEVLLGGEVLDDRLDHEVAVGELAEVATRAVTRPSTAVRSASSSLPRSTCLASDFSRPATIASAVPATRLRSTTSVPALAATSAMPAAHDPRTDDSDPLGHSRTAPRGWKRAEVTDG